MKTPEGDGVRVIALIRSLQRALFNPYFGIALALWSNLLSVDVHSA